MARIIIVVLFVAAAWKVGHDHTWTGMLELLATIVIALGLMRVLSGSRYLSR